MNLKQTIIAVLLVVVAFLGGSKVMAPTLGNSFEANQATTTDSSWETPAATTGGFKLLKTGPGTLDRIIIYNETAGSLTLYDATTTATTTRYYTSAGAIATSTLFKVVANLAEGEYSPNVGFRFGLIAEFQSSNVASATILWK